MNYLTGPTQFTLNLRLSKTFGFGRETGGKGNPAGAESVRWWSGRRWPWTLVEADLAVEAVSVAARGGMGASLVRAQPIVVTT